MGPDPGVSAGEPSGVVLMSGAGFERRFRPVPVLDPDAAPERFTRARENASSTDETSARSSEMRRPAMHHDPGLTPSAGEPAVSRQSVSGLTVCNCPVWTGVVSMPRWSQRHRYFRGPGPPQFIADSAPSRSEPAGPARRLSGEMRVRMFGLRLLAAVLTGLWTFAAAIVLLGYRPGGPIDGLVGLAALLPIAVSLLGLLWPPAARGDRAFAAMAWLGLGAVLLLMPSIGLVLTQLAGPWHPDAPAFIGGCLPVDSRPAGDEPIRRPGRRTTHPGQYRDAASPT